VHVLDSNTIDSISLLYIYNESSSYLAIWLEDRDAHAYALPTWAFHIENKRHGYWGMDLEHSFRWARSSPRLHVAASTRLA